MPTALEYIDKTAAFANNVKGMAALQKRLLMEKDDLAKATKEGAKKISEKFSEVSKNTAKGYKKNKKRIKEMGVESKKNSMVYGGGAGLAGGYGGAKLNDKNDNDEL